MAPLRTTPGKWWFAAWVAISLGGALWVSFAGAASPAFQSLPLGQVSRTPTLDKQPEQVRANEKVTGFYPALPPAGQMAHAIEGTRYVTVFSTEEAARQHSQGGLSRAMGAALAKLPGVEKEPPPLSCFVAADQYHLKTDPQPWPSHAQEQVGVHGAVRGSPAAKQFHGTDVRALHREQLVRDGPDRASLHMTDVWLDPTTLGVRLIGKTKLTLAQLAAGPAGVTVFAARHGDGEAVHFVVQVPRPDEPAFGYWGRHLMASIGNQSSSSDCGHVRLELPAVPGVGERAMVQVDVALSSPEAPMEPDAGGTGGTVGTPTFGPSVMGGLKELRVRTLLVHLSVSQTATDPEPVVSVSFGWLGREKIMQTY
ncbi:MAG: hypothetical protein JRI68_14015 [Deltaproteobacteria bacterium]|nr:hypothetical protein [Deltaproteobacteria bacterium]